MDEKIVADTAEKVVDGVKNEAPKVMVKIRKNPMAMVVVGTVSFVAGFVTAKVGPKVTSKVKESRNKMKIKHDEKNASFKEVEPEEAESEDEKS